MARTMSGIPECASSGGGGDVTQAGTNIFTGTNQYNTNRPTSTIGGGVGLAGIDFITKNDVDTILPAAPDVTEAGANAFTGTNTYNTNRPTSSIAGGVNLAGDDFITKNDVNTLLPAAPDVTEAGTNNFTGTNTFNNSRPTSSLTPPSNPAGDNNFITKKDYNDDLRNGTIVQVKQTYFTGIIDENTTSATYEQIPNMTVSLIRKSSNSKMRVSFLLHYGSNGSSNNWVFNSVRLINVFGAEPFGSRNSGVSALQAGMSCANTFTNGVLQCLPISGCFIDPNPSFDSDGKCEYRLTIRPNAAGDSSQANTYTINSIDQVASGRPRYCSYIMLEEIYQN